MKKLMGTIRYIIPQLPQMDMDKLFIVEVKEPKSKRSLQQNKLLWELVHAIARKTHQDDMDVYCACLERADALSDYVITATEMQDSLRKAFRGVKFCRMQEVNGKDCYIYKVYIGSSKMTIQEMNELLDVCLNICGELGIPTLEYMYD